MAYEVFDNKSVKFGSPQLTIRKGRIAFNADAGDILASVNTKFAHVLWDAATCKLAIRPASKEDQRTFKASFRSGKRGGSFSAQSFLNYIRWNADSPTVLDARWNKAEGLLEAWLPREHVGTVPKHRGA